MNTTELISIDRAIHELRAGREILVDGITVLHPEFITEEKFVNLKSHAKLVVTKLRAKAITGKKFAMNAEIELANLSFKELQILTSGTMFKTSLKLVKNNDEMINSVIDLVKNAELLPSIIYSLPKLPKIRLKGSKNSLKSFLKHPLSSKVIKKYLEVSEQSLKLVTEASLNLCDAETAKILGFRSQNGLDEHYAIIIGDPGKQPLIRIHSSCYTGDLLGSLSCDCGDQLRGAIKLMNEAGGGIIIYLMQEGRGIGLINKLRAYQLQYKGLDTVEANQFLGFDDEERSFGSAAAILKILELTKIKLVTNNPKKISGLEQFGITVTDRIPLIISHQHNKTYLQVKSKKSGHIIN